MPKGGDRWVGEVCGEVSGGGAGGAGRMDADGLPAVWGKGRAETVAPWRVVFSKLRTT